MPERYQSKARKVLAWNATTRESIGRDRAEYLRAKRFVLGDGTDMTEHDKDTEFLKRMLRCEDSGERRDLHDQIAKLQRNSECVKRAAWLAGLFSALGAALLGYGHILLENFPYGTSRMVIRIVCELGLGSLIALSVLVVVLGIYRYKLNRLRTECRRILTRSLELQSTDFDSRRPTNQRLLDRASPQAQRAT